MARVEKGGDVRGSGEVTRRGLLGATAALAGAGAFPPLALAATGAGDRPARKSALETPADAVVETAAGRVRGFVRNGIYGFKGIPYGDTTGEANRFMPPKPPKPWTGVRSAFAWGPIAPQATRGRPPSDEEQFLFPSYELFQSEDMLRANVWTPGIRDGKRRAVMVWLHGGNFTGGSSSDPWNDGANIAARGDVVLVSLNHRLNVLGFLDLSGIGGAAYAQSGNCGMLDLVHGLRWIHENIASFGGDPDNVTIFGQSGGAAKVNTLMAMPSAKGLFHRAIMQSGSTLSVSTRDYTNRLAQAVLAELDLTPARLSEINKVPFERLVAAGIAGGNKMGRGTPAMAGRPGFQPVVDGNILPTHPFNPTAPSVSADVPLLVGSTLDEASPSRVDASVEAMSEQDARSRIAQRWEGKGGELYDAWRALHPNAKPVEIFGWSTWPQNVISFEVASRKAALGRAPAYHYKFNWRTPLLDGRPRAFHSVEIPFAFYNVDAAEGWTGGSEEAWTLAGQVSDAWTNFAKTGNPNHAGLPRWPAFDPGLGQTMIFDTECRLANDPDNGPRQIQAPYILS